MKQVAALGLREYGVDGENLVDRWNFLLRKCDLEKLPMKLVVALNNNDTVKVLLQLLREDPNKVMDGMQIAAYVLDTQDVTLYVPEKEEELKLELESIAQQRGIKICNSDFVDHRELEGCAIHHIETMAMLTEAFSDSYEPGAYVAIQKSGKLSELRRISFGTKLSEVIDTATDEIKGIEIGSKLYDVSALNLVIDATIPLGNGVITVLSKTQCMIDEAEKRLLTARTISCGKCTFCREGLLQLHSMIKEITKGKGKQEYLPLLQEIGEATSISNLCSIGRTGSDFVIGSIANFASEYQDHIKGKKCMAGVCSSFVPIYIDPELCTGCGDCIDVCPVDCIEGKAGYIHMIDELDCTKCGKCIEVCGDEAIKKASGKLPKLPDRLTKCGKFKKH